MRNIHRAVVGATAALTVLVPTGMAYASTGTTTPPTPGQTTPSQNSSARWQTLHEELLEGLQARVQELGTLTSSVNNAKNLSPQDRTALSGLLSSETSGISQLLAQVQAATPQNTTLAQLAADGKAMYDDYRVYVVMARQVHLTEAADNQTTAETRIENNESKIQAAIAKAGNPPDALQAYNDLVAQTSAATQATGQANIPAVIAATPQGWPGDKTTLDSARSALGQADTDLKAARGDLVTIRNVLTQHDSSVNPSAGQSGSNG